MKAGLSLKQTHRVISTIILFCFLVPAVWLFFQDVPIVVSIVFPVLTIIPLFFALKQSPCAKTV